MNYLWNKYKQNANPSGFFVKQRLKSNQKRANSNRKQTKSNKQQAKSYEQQTKGNEERAKTNEQRAKCFTSLCIYIQIYYYWMHFLHQDILGTLYALYDISIYLLSLNIYVCIVLIQHALHNDFMDPGALRYIVW